MEKIIEWWIDFAGYKMGELSEKDISLLEPVRVKLINIMDHDIISYSDFDEVFTTLEKIDTTEKYSRISEYDIKSKSLLDYSISHDVKKAIVHYQKRRKRELTADAGQVIREKREEKNLTLATASNLLGVSLSYLSKIENSSRRIPSSEVLDGICELLEIAKSDLVNYREFDKIDYCERFEIKMEKLLKEITDSQKEGLDELILEIIKLEWTDVSIKSDTAKLVDAVNIYKN